jgi:hypothetical protein
VETKRKILYRERYRRGTERERGADVRYNQGEGPPVCYAVKYMDCTVHGIGASKFPLSQQENLTIELLRAALHIS